MSALLHIDAIQRLDNEDALKARALSKMGRRRHFEDIYVERFSGPLVWAAYAAGLRHGSLLKTPTAMINEFFSHLAARQCTG